MKKRFIMGEAKEEFHMKSLVGVFAFILLSGPTFAQDELDARFSVADIQAIFCAQSFDQTFQGLNRMHTELGNTLSRYWDTVDREKVEKDENNSLSQFRSNLDSVFLSTSRLLLELNEYRMVHRAAHPDEFELILLKMAKARAAAGCK